MSITFKEFSNLLEKSVKSGAQKARSSTGGQKGGKDTSLGMKSTTAKSPGGGGKSKEGKLGGGLTFGGGKKPPKPKKDVKKKDKPDDKKTEPEKETEPEKPTFGGIPLTKRTDAEKDKKQREIQRGKQQAGYAKYRVKAAKDKEEKAKRIEADKKKSAQNAASDQKSDQQKQQDAKTKTANIEKENKKKEQRKKEREVLSKQSEETMNTEFTIKEDWIEDKIIYKLLDKDQKRAKKKFDAMNKSQKMKFVDAVQTITSKNHGYTDSEVEDALDDYGIDISKKARRAWEEVEIQQEAENMHKYINTLSLDRSVNLWSEALKKDEDLDPIKGSKTLTKKTQDKITINPMEKQPSRRI